MNPRRRLIQRSAFAVVLVSLVVAQATAHAVTIDWVTVGNPGNADDTTGYGGVANSYRIGKYDVTIQQYTDFLNAVAKSDPYSLYNTRMATDLNVAGISRTGSSGAYTYSVIGPFGFAPPGASSPGNRPITYVSWFDAARFANWMQNGQGSGSTETGAYTLVGGATQGEAPAVNPGAQFFVPTENQWYKAAYYSPTLNSGSGGYYAYATQSNTRPGNVIGSGANQANFWNDDVYSVTQSDSTSASQNYLTDVGAFTNSASFYGTFDQCGNVLQWNDLDGTADISRGLRGGYWSDSVYLSSSDSITYTPQQEDAITGFRLASLIPVPEPSTWVLGLAGIASAAWGAVRRRKQA